MMPNARMDSAASRLPHRRLLAATVLGLALLCVSGCTYLREMIGLGAQRPKVELVDLAITSINFAAVNLLVTLKVDNPNTFDLKFSKLRYKMLASGQQIASGTLEDHVVVPAESQQQVKLPLSLDAQKVMQLLHDVLTSSTEIQAVLVAAANFETPLGDMEVNFEDKRPLRKLAGF